MIKHFNEKSKIGKIGESMFEDFCQQRNIIYNDMRDNLYHREHDNDYIIEKNNRKLNIEVKTDSKEMYNIPCEIVKNVRNNNNYKKTHKGKTGIGWLYETMSDYIVFFNLESKKMFILNTKRLQDFCTKYKYNYVRKINENPLFNSLNLYVPRKDLYKHHVLVGKYVYNDNTGEWIKENPETELNNPDSDLYCYTEFII
jgi:hypothetical protein